MLYSHVYDYRRYFLLIIAMMGLLRRILKTMLSLYEANNASKPYTYESGGVENGNKIALGNIVYGMVRCMYAGKKSVLLYHR